MESDDVELIIRIARGDRNAVAELYDRHAPVMAALAQRMLRDKQEAEDLLHDVFVEAWQRAGEYDPEHSSVCGWLLVRLRSRCLDRIRWRSRRCSHSGRPMDAVDATMPPSQAELFDTHRVLDALSELDAAQRRVLELTYFQGLSSTEVAARLDIPVGTVKSRVSAGLARLRKVLSDSALTGSDL